jgi:hypothetical protein
MLRASWSEFGIVEPRGRLMRMEWQVTRRGRGLLMAWTLITPRSLRIVEPRTLLAKMPHQVPREVRLPPNRTPPSLRGAEPLAVLPQMPLQVPWRARPPLSRTPRSLSVAAPLKLLFKMVSQVPRRVRLLRIRTPHALGLQLERVQIKVPLPPTLSSNSATQCALLPLVQLLPPTLSVSTRGPALRVGL